MLASALRLVTKADAADVFGVSVKTIDNYIKGGLLPPPKRFVSKEYWHPADFQAFLDRTFRIEAAANGVVQGVSEGLAFNMTGPDGPATARSKQAHTTTRTKDTSPVVRARARREGLLKQLNAQE